MPDSNERKLIFWGLSGHVLQSGHNGTKCRVSPNDPGGGLFDPAKVMDLDLAQSTKKARDEGWDWNRVQTDVTVDEAPDDGNGGLTAIGPDFSKPNASF